MASGAGRRNLDRLWTEYVLERPPSNWTTKYGVLLRESSLHLGLIRIHRHPEQPSDDEVLFTLQARVMAKSLSAAYGTTFAPRPIADSGRWHWTGEARELSDRAIDPWMGVPAQLEAASVRDRGEALRQVVADVMEPTASSKMSDAALLDDRLKALTPPLRLANFRTYFESACLAAALKRWNIYNQFVGELQAGKGQNDLSELDPVFVDQSIRTLKELARA